MRIYLSLLCLAFSSISYGNDLISGYKWRDTSASLTKTAIEQINPQINSQTNSNSANIADEHNNKSADSDIKPNKSSVNCKQVKNHC